MPDSELYEQIDDLVRQRNDINKLIREAKSKLTKYHLLRKDGRVFCEREIWSSEHTRYMRASTWEKDPKPEWIVVFQGMREIQTWIDHLKKHYDYEYIIKPVERS